MASYAECKKELDLTDEEFGKVEESAIRFQEEYGMDANEAFLSAIDSETKALRAGRTKYINDIVNEVGPQQPRKGFADKKPELTQVETKKKKVTKKKVAKKKTTPVFKKPKVEARKAIEGKMEQARVKDAEDKTVAFLETEMAEVEKTLADEAKAKAENLDVPVEEPTAEFIVKHKEAATRAIKMAELEEAAISPKRKDGTYAVSIKAPDSGAQVQDFDAPAGQVLQQVSKAFDKGRNIEAKTVEEKAAKGRIDFVDKNKVVRGKHPVARTGAKELVHLGAMLSGNKIDSTKNLAKQVRDNLNEAFAFLMGKGYELEGGLEGLPGNTVVYGTGITLNNLKQVSKEIETLSKAAKREENIINALEDPNDWSWEESNALKELNKIKRKLAGYGIEVSEGTFNPEEIVGEATDLTVSEPVFPSLVLTKREQDIIDNKKPGYKRVQAKIKNYNEKVALAKEASARNVRSSGAFASLTPEYVGEGTQQRPSKAGPDNKVEAYTSSITPKEVEYTVSLLKHLGIKTNIQFVDEGNIPFIIAGLKEQINSDPKNIATYRSKIFKLEEILEQRPRGRTLYFDKFPNVQDRVPTIFISNKEKGTERINIITHELGHLVQRVSLDQAPKETQQMFRDAAGEMTPKMFDEWFANQLLSWVGKRTVPKSMVEKFFKGLVHKLKQLYDYMFKNFPATETYTEFMDAMVSAEGQRTHGKPSRMKTKIGRQFETEILDFPSAGPFLLRSGMQQSADFTPMTPALKNLLQGSKIHAKKAFNKFKATKVGDEVTHNIEATGETIMALHDALIRAADTKLRAMKNPATTWIADQFRVVPGTKRPANFRDIPTEIRQRSAIYMREIERISREIMPRKYNSKVVDIIFGSEHGRLDKSSRVYKKIGEILVSEKLPDITKLEAEYGKEMANDIVAGYSAARKYLDDLHTYLTDNLGLAVKYRKNYFPHALDVGAITYSKEEFIGILKAEGIAKSHAEVKKGNKTQDEVLEEFYQSLVASDGTLMDLDLKNEGDILGPSFSGLSARTFSPELVAKLNKFYIQDTMSVLTTYTHSAIKRGVIQNRFNPNGELSRDKLTGNNTFDPMYLINKKIAQAEKDHIAGLEGGLTPAQVKSVNKIIDAYLGRTGAHMNPKLRNMSALMVTYQNMRLLSFVVLASIVDAGFIDVRSDRPFASMSALFKIMTDKKQRQELYDAGYMIGALRDDITEHIVNDQASMTYMSHKMKGINESYFKLVRMHQWTNLSRVMSLSAGRTSMVRWANKNNKRSNHFLDELGVTREEILDWDGSMTDIPPNINTALNQFIDQSVIRPDATIRPDWASDPHVAVFWHLKQFMWAYHEVILRRVWNETKNAEGFEKAIPIALLAMATLPLAAAGYELRRWIGYLGDVPEWSEKQGGDYFWEVVQRSGAPGILQLYVDADEAEEHGQFAPMALLGPTATHISDAINKDFGTLMGKSIPFVAQMPAIRSKFYSD